MSTLRLLVVLAAALAVASLLLFFFFLHRNDAAGDRPLGPDWGWLLKNPCSGGMLARAEDGVWDDKALTGPGLRLFTQRECEAGFAGQGKWEFVGNDAAGRRMGICWKTGRTRAADDDDDGGGGGDKADGGEPNDPDASWSWQARRGWCA